MPRETAQPSLGTGNCQKVWCDMIFFKAVTTVVKRAVCDCLGRKGYYRREAGSWHLLQTGLKIRLPWIQLSALYLRGS